MLAFLWLLVLFSSMVGDGGHVCTKCPCTHQWPQTETHVDTWPMLGHRVLSPGHLSCYWENQVDLGLFAWTWVLWTQKWWGIICCRECGVFRQRRMKQVFRESSSQTLWGSGRNLVGLLLVLDGPSDRDSISHKAEMCSFLLPLLKPF